MFIRLKAHKVHRTSPSLLLKKNFVVYQVLVLAGMWKLQSTFDISHLLDLTHKSLDMFSIIPVVAAQQVM